jgi:hypothetical protein
MKTRLDDPGLLKAANLMALAALLPVTASAASVIVHVEPVSWLAVPAATRQGLWREALLYTAGAVVIAAPLAGVNAMSLSSAHARWMGRDVAGVARVLAGAAAICAFASAALGLLFFAAADLPTLRFVAASHATMFAVSFALAAFGAFCASIFADPLDAAACSVALVLVAAGGVLVAGASVANLPLPLLDAAITASPLVAMTSSAHLDIARMAVPYQMSPLARLQVDYPSWYAASGWYLLFACLCLGGVRWKVRSWRSATAS